MWVWVHVPCQSAMCVFVSQGIEFITRSGETMFLVLENHKAREKLYTLVLEQFGQ